MFSLVDSSIRLIRIGINFAIYCILTCTMLHLVKAHFRKYSLLEVANMEQVAITSPDPDFNTDAKEYFKRHMRILENCISAWPLQEMQMQIQSLRQAFSADITKPFELKPSFPYGSPAPRLQPSPPADLHYQDRSLSYSSAHEQNTHVAYNAPPITPPISAGHDDSQDGSMAAASLTMMSTGQRHLQRMPSSHLEDDSSLAWNPTRIFEYDTRFHYVKCDVPSEPANRCPSQWNTAFGTPSSNISVPTNSINQPSPTMYTPSNTSSHDLPHLQDAMQQSIYPMPVNMAQMPQMSIPQASSYASVGHSFVSPSMWQDTVASTYEPGRLKRRWDMGPSSYFNDSSQVKRPK